VGWLQRCLITGLVFISSDSVSSTRGCAIHPAHQISPSWRHRSTAQEQSYKRQNYGVNWRRCLEFGRTSGVTGTGTLRVACCRWDGRAEWHQEEPVIQCDFSMGYSGAAMHRQHRPAMSQARRLASDEWVWTTPEPACIATDNMPPTKPAIKQQVLEASERGLSQRVFIQQVGVQCSVVLTMPTSCVACAGPHSTGDSTLGTGDN
jgi:hypothetical protein